MDFPNLLRVTVNGSAEWIPTWNIERFRDASGETEVLFHSGESLRTEDTIADLAARLLDAVSIPTEPAPQ